MTATDPAWLLRYALRSNAAFSGLAAVVLLVADGLVAAVLGAYDALPAIHAVGVGLAAFAGFLAWLAGRDEIPAGLAWGVIVADLAWVVGSWIAIAGGTTHGQGTWAVAMVADVVLLLAVVQGIGVRRLG